MAQSCNVRNTAGAILAQAGIGLYVSAPRLVLLLDGGPGCGLGPLLLPAGARWGRLCRGGLGRGLRLPPTGARRGRLVVMKGGHGRMTGCRK